MKTSVTLSYILISLLLTSCEKTVVQYVGDTSPVDNNKAFTVIPDTVRVSLFEEFEIRARMENRPLSDVWKTVSLDTSKSPTNNCLLRNQNNGKHFFIDTGRYNIIVQAYDVFADTLIATKFVPALVKTIERYARIEPSNLDTFFHTYPPESPLRIYFNDITNINNSWIGPSMNYPKSRWDFGMGQQYEKVARTSIDKLYSMPGTYLVTLDVYDHFNRIWARDSTTVSIRPANITDQILTSLHRVTVGYNPSQTSPIYETIKYNTPLLVGLDAMHSQSGVKTWDGNDFSYAATYDEHTNNPNKIVEYKLTGRMSPTRDRIEYVNLSVFDSLPSPSGNETTRFGFRLTDLEIIEFNTSRIVYRAEVPVNSHISNEYFTFRNKKTTICGNPDSEILQYFQRHSSDDPYIYLYFSRK